MMLDRTAFELFSWAELFLLGTVVLPATWLAFWGSSPPAAGAGDPVSILVSFSTTPSVHAMKVLSVVSTCHGELIM